MADTLLDDMAAIVAEAATLAHGRASTDFHRWEKSPNNPVCEIDLAVDALLRERLTALLPDAGWLSEESADDHVRLGRRRVWIVDPIDGTRDYIRGRPGWSVSVALVEDGQPVLGVLEAPARHERWRASLGGGAWRNGVRLAASDACQMRGARTPVDALPKIDQDLVAVAKPNSIALRMAMVAAGDADLLATFRWGHEWDVAAAVLLLREAGAAVTDSLGKPLRFNTPRAQAFGVLATAPGLHGVAVERLRPRAIAALGRP